MTDRTAAPGDIIKINGRSVTNKPGQTFLITDIKTFEWTSVPFAPILVGKRWIKSTKKFSGTAYLLGSVERVGAYEFVDDPRKGNHK